jgi:hypothetical protein
MLVAVCGLPGAGKSTVARRVADRTGGVRLRTDVIRRDVVDDPAYTRAERRRVYEEMYHRARPHLDDGATVVLDATFESGLQRRHAARVAADAAAPFELVCVVCDPAVAVERIRARRGDASDADLAVRYRFRETFDPLVLDHLTVDNSGTLAATYEQVDRRF